MERRRAKSRYYIMLRAKLLDFIATLLSRGLHGGCGAHTARDFVSKRAAALRRQAP